MHPGHIRSTTLCWLSGLGACGFLLLIAGVTHAGDGQPPRGTVSREYADAKALFEKLWTPGEAAPSGGDGVGPLFNERSCVGCHHLGGTGGAGPNENNVTILSAQAGASIAHDRSPIFQGELTDLHPGFRGRTSVVLHENAIATSDGDRLDAIRKFGFVQTRDELFQLATSQRSTPALFGSNVIDRIPDSALIEAEARTFPDFPEIKGRLSRLRGGRIGKFGWKGQTASLEDFVMAACANELGLEVRGHHQPSLVPDSAFEPSAIKLDLSDDECRLITRFVASLPPPSVKPSQRAAQGFVVFETIGCATCHAPKLGSVRGLYSDLLLHDLGERVQAFGGGYGGGASTIVENSSSSPSAARPSGEAGPTEWRTTPLWGVADSAPYLHDGRAPTLHAAIMLHGGEAEKTRKRYESLQPRHRQALMAFLKSQVAPVQSGHAISR